MKYAVVTGASSGIGKAFAELFAKKGYSVVLIARNTQKLETLADSLKKMNENVDCIVLTADLSEEDECIKVMKEVSSLKIAYFINNAGFGDCTFFEEGDLQKELNMIDLNVRSLHILTKYMLKHMEKQGGGHILNVGSSAGLFPGGPYMATYYATKAYVVSLSRAIAEELRQHKSPVRISVLCPGPVDTDFNRVANVRFALKGITPEYCAEYAFAQMKKKKVTIIPTMQLRAGIRCGRWMNQNHLIRIVAHQQKKKNEQNW